MFVKRAARMAKRIICGKYNDTRFWRYRHALCKPGSISPLKKVVYAQYCERMMRRYCADIAIGWDDDTAKICENFAGPPSITNHGINGIVIAGGGEDWQERCHLSSSDHWSQPRTCARNWGQRLHRAGCKDLRRYSCWQQREDWRQLRRFPGRSRQCDHRAREASSHRARRSRRILCGRILRMERQALA